eukprot:g298.t1
MQTALKRKREKKSSQGKQREEAGMPKKVKKQSPQQEDKAALAKDSKEQATQDVGDALLLACAPRWLGDDEQETGPAGKSIGSLSEAPIVGPGRQSASTLKKDGTDKKKRKKKKKAKIAGLDEKEQKGSQTQEGKPAAAASGKSGQDVKKSCTDCGASFVFSAELQQLHAERGWPELTRCLECRQKKKSGRKFRKSKRRAHEGGKFPADRWGAAPGVKGTGKKWKVGLKPTSPKETWGLAKQHMVGADTCSIFQGQKKIPGTCISPQNQINM